MLPTEYQNYIAISRYARWIEKENRREIYLFDFLQLQNERS